jgi:hypothetical protein
MARLATFAIMEKNMSKFEIKTGWRLASLQ